MNYFFTRRSIAAIHLAFLVAPAVEKFAASTSDLVGLLALLIARFFAVFVVPFLKFFKNFPSSSGSSVISRTI